MRLSSKETILRLFEIIEICDTHFKRVNYAKSQLYGLFPLDIKVHQSLADVNIALIDQMIYRFTRLHDIMGSKLFYQALKSLGEDYSEKPIIDVLNRLEKLELIQDHRQWIMMSEVRNQLSHEYLSEPDKTIDGLNSLYRNVSVIAAIYTDLRRYLRSQFQV